MGQRWEAGRPGKPPLPPGPCGPLPFLPRQAAMVRAFLGMLPLWLPLCAYAHPSQTHPPVFFPLLLPSKNNLGPS